MLTLSQDWYPIVSVPDSLALGSIVYWQKQAVGAPIGLLLALTSPGKFQKALVTANGLAPII